MKSSVSILLLAGALSAPFISAAQEVAGRVVAVAGDVSIIRGQQKTAAQRGAEVFAGDTLQLGSQSNAQVMFTDEAIVALRPETEFRIREYAYQGRGPDAGRAFFNLVKGGMRTVTGLIGRRNHENYGVNTPVAMVAIRGTNYSLVHCDDSCRNPNGALAPNGTYGGVTDGRIGVINDSGEHQFGHDQYFHVASVIAAPQSLIAPPGFLRDTLEGRARSSGKQTQVAGKTQQQQQASSSQAGSATSSTVAPTGQSGGTGDTSVSASISSVATPPQSLTTNVFQVTNNATSTSSGLTTLLQPTFTGTVFYRVGGSLQHLPVSCTIPPCGSISFGEFTVGINYAAGRATVSTAFTSSDGAVFNFSTPASSGGIPITVSGGQVAFSGTFKHADYPLNNGAFRCSNCGTPNPSGIFPGYVDSLGFFGTVNGSQLTFTLSATDVNGNSHSGTATLPQATPPNNSAAAITWQNQAGGGSARSSAYWNVQLGSSGQLLGAGTLVGVGHVSVGSATNTIVGSAPSAGNLVWGKWTGPGAVITDFNYVTYTSGSGSVQPWITGEATSNIPLSLGTQTYAMIPGASIVNGGNGVLNAASLTADFVNQLINVSLNATSGTTGSPNTYQMNAIGGFLPTSGRFSQGFNSVTCTGPCRPGFTPSGNLGGFFAGPQAQGAGIAFTAGFGTAGFPGVTGVVGMKR